MERMTSRRDVFLICAVLVLATAGVYWRVQGHEFLYFDDLEYVTENEQVLGGLTGEGFVWAFRTMHSYNWHPLTWLSLMLDCELFESKSLGCHVTNVLFHIANTLLLFLVLKRMTGGIWRSGFVAAAFALHPLHVESVAWVSERKDVLSTFFWLLTMLAYVGYTERRSFGRYALIVLFFALGLMAKPMLVTLPFVLLLLDYWPLGRLRFDESGGTGRTAVRLLWEKVPLFVLTVISSVVTYVAQQSGGSVWSVERIRLKVRLANAVVSYGAYIGKMIWPSRLAVFYPYGIESIWQVTEWGLVLAGLSAMAVLLWRRRPYLLVGWLWYLGTLVPVIGLVQVGEQSMADRYTYVPLIGLFIMIAWGAVDYVKVRGYSRIGLWIPAGAVLLVLAVCTWRQVGYWRDTVALFEHTLAVTSENHRAHNVLAVAFAKGGQTDKAIEQYRKSLELAPDLAVTHSNLGELLVKRGEVDKAIVHHREAVRLDPYYAPARVNLGKDFALKGDYAEAIKHYQEALRIEPDQPQAYNNMGAAVLNMGGEPGAAEEWFQKALEFEPDYDSARINLATVLLIQGRFDEAIWHCRKALQAKPGDERAQQLLEAALAKRDELSKR